MAYVKSLKVTYNPPNENNIFTNGDNISGHVHLEVTKECHIDALLIKFKGKAEVKWTERHNKRFTEYQSKEKYFSMKGYFIRNKVFKGGDKQTFLMNQNGATYSSVVPPGCYVYPFTFQFPLRPLPSSFSGPVGTIVYSLEARLKRSMNMDLTYSEMVNFASKTDLMAESWLTTPQHGFDNHEQFFSSKEVYIDVKLEKNGFFQGEGLMIEANVKNRLSRAVNPKYRIYRKSSFFANDKKKVESKDLLKESGEPIPPFTDEKITRLITIPHDMEPSIQNCNIIKVEHRLLVYVGVKHAFDPEVNFPIVILPATSGPKGAVNPSAPTYGFGAFANTDMPGGTSFLQNPTASGPSAPPPPYQTGGMYPSFSNCDEKL